jgi:hypothetical protein
MTLNVNLEDVPWEILEAVRLRILAERRAMEQSRLQRRPIALRPQAQFAKLGARADQRRLPEPAAMLDDGINLPYFYLSVDLPQNSVLNPGPRIFTLASGNGKQVATATLDDPFPNLPALQIPLNVLAWGQYQPSGPDLAHTKISQHRRDNWPSRTVAQFEEPFRQVTFGVNFFNRSNLRRGLYSKSRAVSTSFDNIDLFLPLGDGKCLCIFAVRDSRISHVFERGFFYDLVKLDDESGITIQDYAWTESGFFDYVNNTSASSEQLYETNTDSFRHLAFVCSFTEARQVQIPQTLIDEVYSLLRLARVDTTARVRVDFRGFLLESGYNNNFAGARFPIYSRTVGAGLVFAANRILFPLYGIKARNSLSQFLRVLFCTPSAWIAISAGNLPSPLLTHEECQAFTTGEDSVAELIKRGYFLGIVDSLDLTDPPSKRVLFWRGGLPTGNLIDVPIVPEPQQANGNWGVKTNSVPAIAGSEQSTSRVYIYDWNNPQFCRQQAERWGVANL